MENEENKQANTAINKEEKEEEIIELLEKNLEVSEDTNKKMSRLLTINRWRFIVFVIQWVVIIGSALGIYYFLGPKIGALLDVYRNILGSGFNGLF